MFGREPELSRIEQLLDALPAGPAGLVFEGDPGVGKTLLWRAAVDAARARGLRVLVAAPSEPEAALGFAGLGDLMEDVPGAVLADLPDARRRALDAALVHDDALADADPERPSALARAVLDVLRALAERGPVLVAIDDEQWLDRASARVLAFALRRVRDEPVGIVLTRRRGSESVLWAQVREQFAGGAVMACEVTPLSREALGRLLVTRLQRPISLAVTGRIYDACGGNPLYALAIAEELARADPGAVGDSALPIPATLGAAIEQRVARLPVRAREPLLVTAALSAPTLAALQASVADFSLTDLDEAVDADVIEIVGERVRFTHPLLASTVYARATPGRRRALHRVLAETVGDEVERARHLALGAEAPQRRTAILIEQAAGTAERRGAPETAAELLEHAARLTPARAPEARRSRVVAAAQRHKVAGDQPRARALLEAVLSDMPRGPLRARALHDLARLRMDDFAAATTLLEAALGDAADHHRVAADIHLLLAELSSNRGDRQAAMAHGEAALDRAERAGDPGALADMLAARALHAFLSGSGVPREDLARAIALEDEVEGAPAYGRASQFLGSTLFWSDELDVARPLLEGCLRRATQRGQEYDRGELMFHLAHLEWVAGNVTRAQDVTTELLAWTARSDDDQADCYALWLRAFVAARAGQLPGARRAAEDAIEVAARIGDHFIVSFSGAIVAATELWSGVPEAAHDRLAGLRAGLVGGDTGFVGSLTLPLWALDIEALVALQRSEEAAAVLAHLTARADRAANPNAQAVAARCAALIAYAQGDPHTAVGALHEALAAHALRPLPLEVGRTLLELGSLQRRLKRKADAKRSLQRAREILEPIGAQMWAGRARDELGRLGLRRSRSDGGLTAAQQRVAELVIAGRTNREIAGELFMSLRTVETHLTAVYRHHGVRSRGQLVAALREPALSAPTRPASDPARADRPA